jgi:hypothetical protein
VQSLHRNRNIVAVAAIYQITTRKLFRYTATRPGHQNQWPTLVASDQLEVHIPNLGFFILGPSAAI